MVNIALGNTGKYCHRVNFAFSNTGKYSYAANIAVGNIVSNTRELSWVVNFCC